jgi:hypothetical protein
VRTSRSTWDSRCPPDADDVRWAYRNGFQDDAAALTFTGPSEGMETFVDEIDGEHLPGLAMHGGGQTEFFTRLDVQSPEGLAGAKARGAQVYGRFNGSRRPQRLDGERPSWPDPRVDHGIRPVTSPLAPHSDPTPAPHSDPALAPHSDPAPARSPEQ